MWSSRSIPIDGYGAVAPAEVALVDLAATTALVALRGDHDLATAPALETALATVLADGAGRSVVIDLREADTISCATVAALLTGQERLRAHGGELTVRGPGASAMRVLDLTALGEQLGLAPTSVADALRPLHHTHVDRALPRSRPPLPR